MDRLEFLKNQQKKHPEASEYCLSNKPDWVELGRNCKIHRGVFFSPQGFGFEKVDGKWIHIPHSGNIIIGDNVEIFEDVNIVRPTYETTGIGSGTKIDYNCHIAHNVIIGCDCLVIAGSIIGGSVQIGNDCYLGIGCMIKNKVKIGNNVTIGMGAVVVKNVPDNITVVGNPAKIL